MKIVKIGTWDKFGLPQDWCVWGDNSGRTIIKITEDGKVLVGGIEIVPWTEERKKAMEET